MNDQHQKQAKEILEFYKKMMGEQESFSALIMGIQGVGKSTLACTGRLPILIDSFDPKGTLFIHTNPILKKLYDNNQILIRPFWDENSKDPKMYAKWETQWQKDNQNNFLSNFGTYVIDSGTTLLESLSNYWRRKKGRGDNLEIQDYIPIYNVILDIVKISSSHDCDFLMIWHLVETEDDSNGSIRGLLDAYKGLRAKAPKLFTEKYVMVKKKTPKGIVHVLKTNSTGKYEASSQFAGLDNIPNELEIDLRKEGEIGLKEILKLAGLKTSDKEDLFKEEI